MDGRYYRSYSKLDAAKGKELDFVDMAEPDSRKQILDLMSRELKLIPLPEEQRRHTDR